MTDAAALPPADDDADAQAAMSWVQRHAAQPPEGHWDELRNRLAQAATPGLVGPPLKWQDIADDLARLAQERP